MLINWRITVNISYTYKGHHHSSVTQDYVSRMYNLRHPPYKFTLFKSNLYFYVNKIYLGYIFRYFIQEQFGTEHKSYINAHSFLPQ